MRGQGLLSAVVIGASIILAAVAFALVGHLLRSASDVGPEAMLAQVNRDLSALEARIGATEQAVDGLRREIDRLDDRFAEGLATPAAPTSAAPPLDQSGSVAPRGNATSTADLIQGMRISRGRFNEGIERPRPSVLRELIGEPRAQYSDDCQPPTNAKLNALLETRQIGSFKVTMVRPALDSLQEVFDRFARDEPDIAAALGTQGALCARHVRGAPNTVSSHAWGMAIDLELAGNLDQMGDQATQMGLVVLAEYFNDAGWFWGAGYEREDSMHFEPGEAILRQWAAEGRL